MGVGYLVRGAPDAIVFQTYSDLEGYLWSFPRVDHASVGIATRLGAVPPEDLWYRLDRFLAETCPDAKKEKRWSGLLPMAQDASLWDTAYTGRGWSLLGDAAGHVHPLTGEGIAYALWSAELLAEAFVQGDPQVYEELWGKAYGDMMITTGRMLSNAHGRGGEYEIVFQLAMAASLSSEQG
jgi:flavin-dependent dehydrogenase